VRQTKIHDVEQLIKILAEIPFRDRILQVSLGCRDDAKIDHTRIVGPDGNYFALFRDAQQLRLHGQVHAVDFVEVASQQLGVETFKMNDSVRRHLVDHDWPGNARELRNFAFNAVLGLPEVDKGFAAEPLLPLAKRVERFESSAICDAMRAGHGDISKAMELLGLPRKTLYDKLARHGIDPKQFRV
jgi:transcriptional regulator with GAF, ATPase, and Fis domain